MITTYRDALKKATVQLISLGWERETAFLEAALLLCKATGMERIKLLTSLEEPLSGESRHTYETYLDRRMHHEPLQYILGKQTFMSLDFAVTPDVLVPRGETELLVQEVLRFAQGDMSNIPESVIARGFSPAAIQKVLDCHAAARNDKWDKEPVPVSPDETSPCPTVLDLCTGSGAIAVSLAYYLPQARITAVDISPAALNVARANAAAHGVSERLEFYCGDMFAPLPRLTYDIITCNPPYISASEYEELPADVRKEPRRALFAGADGLDYYRTLGAQAGGFLSPGGRLFLEIGAGQAAAVTEILQQNGFRDICVIRDWNKHDRVITCMGQGT